jgi:hypothetical protein
MKSLQSFFGQGAQPKLVERTQHRAFNGGFESWIIPFKNNINYYFLGDIRFLEKSKEKALFVNIYKKIQIREDSYDYSTVQSLEDSNNFNILSNVITKLVSYIQQVREYRYIAFVINSGWENLHTLIKEELQVVELTDIKQEIFELFSEPMQIEIDSGRTNFYICDIYKK